MQLEEIIFLCVIVAAAFFIMGSLCGSIWDNYKCHHHFEEVVNTTVKGKPVVVHICKKCGKRKITRV